MLEINALMAHMTDIGTPAVQAMVRERLVAALYAIESSQPATTPPPATEPAESRGQK